MFSSLPCSSTGHQPCLRQSDTKRSWAQTTSSPSSTCRRPPTRPCSEYSSASVRASGGVSTPSVHPVSESFSEHRDEIQFVVMAELKPQPQPCLWKFIHASNKCCAMCWSRGPSSWPLEALSSSADESWGSSRVWFCCGNRELGRQAQEPEEVSWRQGAWSRCSHQVPSAHRYVGAGAWEVTGLFPGSLPTHPLMLLSTKYVYCLPRGGDTVSDNSPGPGCHVALGQHPHPLPGLTVAATWFQLCLSSGLPISADHFPQPRSWVM